MLRLTELTLPLHHADEALPAGPGYAGGILSAAVDGFKAAEAVAQRFVS